MSSANTARLGPLLLLGLIVISLGLALVVDPGPFSIDEATYQHMVLSLRERGSLTVWNGYEEFPTAELTSRWIRPSGGHLYGQYPYLYVLLAAPFQALLGFRGLFVINAVAFGVATWLCHRLALQLLGSRAVAQLAAALFALASYAGSYAIAAWPHMLSVALVLAACSLTTRAAQHALAADSASSAPSGAANRGGRPVPWCAFAAGALSGTALGVRLDTVLIVPVLLAPLLLARPVRWRSLTALALGAAGPLVCLAVINGLRWGIWFPVTYGRSIVDDLPAAVALTALCAAFAVAWRSRQTLRFTALRRRLGWVAGSVALASLLLPWVRELAWGWMRGAWILLVDLSALPLDRAEAGLSRTPDGGVVYVGTLKKALLQSCPYLAVLAALLPTALRSRAQPPGAEGHARGTALLALFAAPALVIAFYARSAWHGGLAFNLRYFCLCLPFLSILCAHAITRIASGDERAHARAGGFGFALAAAALVALPVWQLSAEGAESWLARPALLIALLTGLTTLAWVLRPQRWLGLSCAALVGVGAAWAAGAGLGYDATHAQQVRSVNYQLGTFVGQHVTYDSILFVHFPDPFYSVLDVRQRVRIAIPASDRFRDMGPLTDFHLARGRQVFAVFEHGLWSELEKLPAARRYGFDPVAQLGPYSLRQVRSREPLRTATSAPSALTAPTER